MTEKSCQRPDPLDGYVESHKRWIDAFDVGIEKWRFEKTDGNKWEIQKDRMVMGFFLCSKTNLRKLIANICVCAAFFHTNFFFTFALQTRAHTIYNDKFFCRNFSFASVSRALTLSLALHHLSPSRFGFELKVFMELRDPVYCVAKQRAC